MQWNSFFVNLYFLITNLADIYLCSECKYCFQSLKTYQTLVTIIAEESNRVAGYLKSQTDFLERRNGDTTLFIGHLCTYLMLFNFIQTIWGESNWSENKQTWMYQIITHQKDPGIEKYTQEKYD